ncbi:MAG: hypothetical protein AAF553_11125 [Pseudomonadota bacterium]
MRVLVDLIENFADGVRLIVALIAMVVTVGIMVFAFGASYVATDAVEEFAEHAEEVSKESIRTQEQAMRNRELAKEGWGYEPSPAYDTGGEFGEEAGPEDRRRKREPDDWGVAN